MRLNVNRAIALLFQPHAADFAQLVYRVEDTIVTALHPVLLCKLLFRLVVCIVSAERTPVETFAMMLLAMLVKLIVSHLHETL